MYPAKSIGRLPPPTPRGRMPRTLRCLAPQRKRGADMTREGWLARVRQEKLRIILREGAAHVGGRYFADEHSANLQRRWEAEVRASRALARGNLGQG